MSAPSTAALQRLAVLLQLLLRRLEFGHTGIEVGQQFFEFGDDAGLFGGRRQPQGPSFDNALRNIWLRAALACVTETLFL